LQLNSVHLPRFEQAFRVGEIDPVAVAAIGSLAAKIIYAQAGFPCINCVRRRPLHPMSLGALRQFWKEVLGGSVRLPHCVNEMHEG
jgi:hypothetical protein